MYFLSKFCRICVRTDVQLFDIEMIDFDAIKLSQKLEICGRLTVAEEPLPCQICQICTNKLRVSYNFQEMCQKSTVIIQNYLSKLTEYSEETDTKFENWSVEVAVSPLPKLGIVSIANHQTKSTESAHEQLTKDQNYEDDQLPTQNTEKKEIVDEQKTQEDWEEKIKARIRSTEVIKVAKVPIKTSSISEESPLTIKNFQSEPKLTEPVRVDRLPSIMPVKPGNTSETPLKRSKSDGVPITTEVFRIGKIRKPLSKPTDIFPESRIRVKNFLNESIQHQSETIPNQNVLSRIEKVVHDVPSTFKKQPKSRITKEQRCSMLKQLLTPSPSDKQKKERDKSAVPSCSTSKSDDDGLKGIMDFTENFKFKDKKVNINTILNTPLDTNCSHIDKLKEFAQNYFKRKSFVEFKNTVMYIIEHKDDFIDSCSEDSDFDDERTESATETEDEDGRLSDMDYEDNLEDTQSTFDYIVETHSDDDELGLVTSDEESTTGDTTNSSEPKEAISRLPPTKDSNFDSSNISETIKVKQEPQTDPIDESCTDSGDFDNLDVRVKPEFIHYSEIKGLIPSARGECSGEVPGPSAYGKEFEMYLNKYTSESVNMLDHLVSTYPMEKKMFTPWSARCRTKNNPYISPQLLNQFQLQCFKCDKCNRRFKSQGYLKAHTSKVH